MTVETWHLIPIGLALSGLYLHRAALARALQGPAIPPTPPVAPIVRLVETPTAPQPALTTTAELLSLVHHRTEADALQRAHEVAAAAIVDAKAKAKAAGLPWQILATPSPQGPPPPNP